MLYFSRLCALSLLMTGLAYARLSITLTQAGRDAMEVHVSGGSAETQKIIHQDINLSGLLKTSPTAPTQRQYRIDGSCLFKSTERNPLFCAPTQMAGYRSAHLMAERIFEDSTGKKGWFSSRIALVSSDIKTYKNRTYRLEVMDSLGEHSHTIFQSKAPIMSPSWSPDGQFIAYVSFENGKASLWQQHLGTGKRTRLSDAPGINGAPAWSPDGQTLAFVLSPQGTPKIALLNLKHNSIRIVTHGPSLDTEPCWHPSGNKLFYTSSRGSQPQIYELDLATGATRRVTFFGDYNATSSISADGTRLATLTRQEGRFMVVVHNLKNTSHTILSAKGTEEQPMIHRGGEVVLFGIREHNRMQIAMAQVDTSLRYQLPSDQGWARFASWSP